MHSSDLPRFVTLSDEVARALREARPVVALESAVISHGLPHPTGIETAGVLEADVRAAGAVPATIAVVDGQILIGTARDNLRRLTRPGTWKIADRCDDHDNTVASSPMRDQSDGCGTAEHGGGVATPPGRSRHSTCSAPSIRYFSAVTSFIVPDTGELLNAVATNAFTFLGAACFFVGAYLLLPEDAAG